MAKKKVQKLFTNLIIIDASGSMQDKVQEVINGLKKLFSDIKADAIKNPDVKTTTIVLDFSSFNDLRVLVNSTSPEDLKDEIADKYVPRDWTALYDAIGKGFSLIPEKQDGVFINILTDGQENNSKEFNQEKIKKLIGDAKLKNWVVTFMGTTEEAINNAVSLGVSQGNTVCFADSAIGVRGVLTKTSNARSSYYTSMTTNAAINLDTLMEDTK